MNQSNQNPSAQAGGTQRSEQPRNNDNRNRHNSKDGGNRAGDNRNGDFHNRARGVDMQAIREQQNALAMKNYSVGQVVEATIIHFFKAGVDHPHMSALVKLSQGGTALLLFDQVPCYPRNILSEIWTKNDVIDVEITALKPSKSRISVSLEPVLRRKFAGKLERGHIVEATIIERIGFGYFVDLGGLRALLHDDNLDKNFQDQDEVFEDGEKTEVVILTNELDGRRIGVGRWQMFEYM